MDPLGHRLLLQLQGRLDCSFHQDNLSQSSLFTLHTEYANLLCFLAIPWADFLFLLVYIVPDASVNGIQISEQREIPVTCWVIFKSQCE